MYKKEKLQPNKVNAPVLFIGVGGIGSKIIKGVADRCINDDTSNIRFLVMDTDVNDLLSVNKGVNITAVQTSSTSSIGDYLVNDKNAKEKWFPVNKMLESKSVSEGAGQIRAISRLALNATIKQGKIRYLYNAIDDLFLKDGGGLKQAIKVVVASTVAGGTGSGIAMEIGMLVRNYVKKNYPEAAVMIRGFLVMPGVMDTVIKTQSEKDSVRCNGYATIKEINAFMMKGSGFFDTVPELHRYKDLHITIPSTTSGEEKLCNLPFDFCFLMDRTDSNEGNMISKEQYIEYAAQSVYEQNIGPMRSKASSMEDNVLKLCISPEKLGRCRFGGAGASVLRYPYDEICEYIALNWARIAVIGSSDNDELTDEERKALLEGAWLQYDAKFEEEYKNWEDNPSRSGKDEPTRAKTYTSAMEGGKESSAGNEFTAMLWDKYLTPKIDMIPDRTFSTSGDDFSEDDSVIEMQEAKNTKTLAKDYIMSLIEEVIKKRLRDEFPEMGDCIEFASKPVTGKNYKAKYTQIQILESISKSERLSEISKNFAKDVFSSKSSIEKDNLGEYMLEKYLSINGKAIHPNAARHLLYELQTVLEAEYTSSKVGKDLGSYEKKLSNICYGPKDEHGKADVSEYQVKWNFGTEKDLKSMCAACDNMANDADKENCNSILTRYFSTVQEYYINVIENEICSVAIPAIERLVTAYENFYKSFASKVKTLEKKKEDIVTKLEFRNGDCVRNLLGKKEYLDKLSSMTQRPSDTGKEASRLYSKIFDAIRNNAYIDMRRGINKFEYQEKADIFDDIIVEYYKEAVEETCDMVNVKGVLQGAKLEHDIHAEIELEGLSEELREIKQKEFFNKDSIRKYIMDVLDVCNNLASPGIKKKDHDESREVSAIACNEGISDGAGIRVSEYLPEVIKTPTVSKYDLCFFRSVYNIMPTQLSKLSAPIYEEDIDEFSYTGEGECGEKPVGDYFNVYQKYMDKIGPDCRTSAIITPHIDMRWNAISVMPELDIEYQKLLMRKIHKSMIYGILYNRIRMEQISDDNPDTRIYRYLNNDNDIVDLVVSNGTKCDVLYEVLDALYFDRLAVATIREYVQEIRRESENRGYSSLDDAEFFKQLGKLTYKNFSNNIEIRKLTNKVSLFEIVLLYCNSLPVQSKDEAEMKTMIEAVIEIVEAEMKTCTPNKDSLDSKVADLLIEQFNLFVENYINNKEVLRCGLASDAIIDTVQRILWKLLKNKELASYKNKMVSFERD